MLEHFFLSFAVFTVLFLCFSVFLAFLNIKLTIIVGVVFIIISILLFVFTKIFNKENINTKIEKWDYLILSLFLCSVFAKVVSVVSFEVPGLHDPITHAYFSKQIVDTGYINYFYSPGLHILSAFGKMFNGFDVAKQILYITNFFNAYIGVIIYLFVKHIFKKYIWAISSAVLFSLGYFPAMFFVNAGKNALVMAIVLLFFFMFLVNEYRKKKSIQKLVLVNLTIMSIFIVHYPIGVFSSTYLLATFFVDFRKEKFRTVLLGIGVLFALMWMVKAYQYQTVVIAQSATVSDSSLFTIPKNVLNSTVDLIKQTWNAQMYKESFLARFIAYFSSLSFICICIKSFKKKEYLVLVLWTLFSFIISLILSLFSIKPILIVLETYLISIFIYVYLFAGNFVQICFNLVCRKLNKRMLATVFAWSVAILTVLLSVKMYKTFYERNNMHNLIQGSDLRSFDWINKNIPDEEKFLINANGSPGLVFSTDGGGWLEVFTDNEISKPFYDFGSKKTGDNVNLYYQLKEDLGSCEYINTFIDRGYEYYYQGSRPVFDEWLGKQKELIESGRFELLFEDGDSEVYRLIPCE